MCARDFGLTFGAKMHLDGKSEGRLIVYRANKYPYECMGQVKFMWKPSENGAESMRRTIWIWSHPSFYEDFRENILEIFQLKETINAELGEEQQPKRKKAKMTITTIKTSKSSKYYREDKTNEIREYASTNNNVKLLELKGMLNRFKLIGPLSTIILANVLETIKPNSDDL